MRPIGPKSEIYAEECASDWRENRKAPEGRVGRTKNVDRDVAGSRPCKHIEPGGVGACERQIERVGKEIWPQHLLVFPTP
jgi:hypothetical protein